MLGQFNVLLFFDPTAHRNDDLRLGQVNRLLRFLKDFLRLVPDYIVSDFDFHGFHLRGGRCRFHFIASERPVLESHEPWSIARKSDVGCEFALKHLPCEKQLVTFFFIAYAITNSGALHGCGELWHKIAHLVGVRH